MRFTIEIEKRNGTWMAEISEWPSLKATGQTQKEAIAKVQALAFQALQAQRIDNGETLPDVIWQWKDKEIQERGLAVQRIDALRSRLFSTYGEMPDSTPLIQEDRLR